MPVINDSHRREYGKYLTSFSFYLSHTNVRVSGGKKCKVFWCFQGDQKRTLGRKRLSKIRETSKTFVNKFPAVKQPKN